MYNNQLRKHIREAMAHHQSEHDELIWLNTFDSEKKERKKYTQIKSFEIDGSSFTSSWNGMEHR